ncbi:MAG TPA: hypothetical protein VOB72_09705 [Candidatus Dormibacteraeota bacterium]|nr:hypothetical protein [Candidatus Dormibacteraeota bacterium]
MLITPAVRAAHARRDLHPGLRYAVVRLAELLDPDTPFALSGCAYCDPLAATSAFEEAARDSLAHAGVRFGTVLAASQLLSDALEQEGNLRTWYPGDLTRLLLFTAQLRKVPAVKTLGERKVTVPYHERTTWVRQKLGALVNGSLARFRAAIEAPGTGYRDRLLDQLAGRLCAGPADERGWAELEHDLCYAAALLLGEGRDGRMLASALAAAVAAAPDAPGAAAALREVAAAPPAAYEVALVLIGAASLEPDAVAQLGVHVLDAIAPGWAACARGGAERALGAFVTARTAAGDATALRVAVHAWDPEQARRRAFLAAQSLRDHLIAAHPEGRFALADETLVLDVASGRAAPAGAGPKPIRRGRVPSSGSPPELLPFLRANALARGEASPALRVLHAWIALECLARDGGAEPVERPTTQRLEGYLPPHLASVSAMAGLHALLLSSWDTSRALALRSPERDDWLRLERRLQAAPGRPLALTALVALLRAPDPPARELLDELGPFPARRLSDLGRRFGHGSRLAKAAEAIQVRTLIAIARLKLTRHLAVHRGFDAAEATPALGHAAVQVLDSAFEVLRRWLRPGAGPADALAQARRWHEHSLAAWRATAELELDADHLLHPEKQ